MASIAVSTNYKKIDCCDNTRNIDCLLNKYREDKEIIYELLVKNPELLVNRLWNSNNPLLSIDRKCQCKMGIYDEHLTLKSGFACPQCKNLMRIIDLIPENINKPFKIRVGNQKGKLLIIHQVKDLIPSIKIINSNKSNMEGLLEYYNKLAVCDSKINLGQKFIASDKFTNRFLNSLVIERIFNASRAENSVVTETGFICANDGYVLDKEPDIGSFDLLRSNSNYVNQNSNLSLSLKNTVSKDILKQLVIVLKILSSNNFCHNDATIQSLKFDSKFYKQRFYGKDIVTNITLMLTNFDFSSIDVDNNLRLHNNSIVNSLFVRNGNFAPEVESKVIVPVNYSNSNMSSSSSSTNEFRVYKFNSEVGKQLLHLRRNGLSLYNTSFDLYCFLISLMSETAFFNSVVNDKELYSIWSSIWLPNDFKIIMQRLNQVNKRIGTKLNVLEVIELLSGLYLRCEIMNYLWNLL